MVLERLTYLQIEESIDNTIGSSLTPQDEAIPFLVGSVEEYRVKCLEIQTKFSTEVTGPFSRQTKNGTSIFKKKKSSSKYIFKLNKHTIFFYFFFLQKTLQYLQTYSEKSIRKITRPLIHFFRRSLLTQLLIVAIFLKPTSYCVALDQFLSDR